MLGKVWGICWHAVLQTNRPVNVADILPSPNMTMHHVAAGVEALALWSIQAGVAGKECVPAYTLCMDTLSVLCTAVMFT